MLFCVYPDKSFGGGQAFFLNIDKYQKVHFLTLAALFCRQNSAGTMRNNNSGLWGDSLLKKSAGAFGGYQKVNFMIVKPAFILYQKE